MVAFDQSLCKSCRHLVGNSEPGSVLYCGHAKHVNLTDFPLSGWCNFYRKKRFMISDKESKIFSRTMVTSLRDKEGLYIEESDTPYQDRLFKVEELYQMFKRRLQEELCR